MAKLVNHDNCVWTLGPVMIPPGSEVPVSEQVLRAVKQAPNYAELEARGIIEVRSGGEASSIGPATVLPEGEMHNFAEEKVTKEIHDRRRASANNSPSLVAMQAIGMRSVGLSEGEVIGRLARMYGVSFNEAESMLRQSEAYDSDHQESGG